MKPSPMMAAFAASTTLAMALAPQARAEDGEIAQLRAQLQALQARLDEIERQQQAQQEAQDRTADVLAQTKTNVGEWVDRFTFKGDLRYRNEQSDVESVQSDRIRDRVRARAGFVARINEHWRAEVQLATGGADPRSSNQTLTGVFSRKDFGLDLAYAEWSPTQQWRLTLGKMKQPWARPGQSQFIDTDFNPEGIAVGYAAAGGLFGTAFYYALEERGGFADSTMFGAQLGWRSAQNRPVRLTAGVGYYDFGAVQGYALNAPASFNAFGNTTTTDRAVCRAPVPAGAACLASDFVIAQVFGEVGFTAAGRPLTLFADYGHNGEADAEDTAWGAGVSYGRVSGPRSWEIGYLYQEIEKDALLGQLVDSDFGDGNTDSRGSVFRFGYGISRNFAFNATYYLNELNVSGLSAGVPLRDYRKLQLDLNYRF